MAALATLSNDVSTGALVPTDGAAEAKVEAAAAEVAAEAAAAQIAYFEAGIPAGETVHFRERGVALTENYALLNFTTYQLRDIYAANLREVSGSLSVVYGVLLCSSVLALLVAWVSVMGAAITVVSGGLIALILRLSVPSNHILSITTADGQRDALLSRDRAYLTRIFEALNDSLAHAHR